MKSPKDSDLNEAFEKADTSGDGVVDWDEFVELFEKVKKGEVQGLGPSQWDSTVKRATELKQMTRGMYEKRRARIRFDALLPVLITEHEERVKSVTEAIESATEDEQKDKLKSELEAADAALNKLTSPPNSEQHQAYLKSLEEDTERSLKEAETALVAETDEDKKTELEKTVTEGKERLETIQRRPKLTADQSKPKAAKKGCCIL